MLYCTVFGIAFAVFGGVFATGSMLGAIPAWNRMPEKEKQAIRALPLCRNIGGMIALAGILLLLAAFVPALSQGVGRMMLGWFALCTADLIYIHKSGRYTQRERNTERVN